MTTAPIGLIRLELTFLAVDAVKAWGTFADVLAEDVPPAGGGRRQADAVVVAGVGAAGTWGGEELRQRLTAPGASHHSRGVSPLSVSLQLSPSKPSGQMQMRRRPSAVTQVPPLLQWFT